MTEMRLRLALADARVGDYAWVDVEEDPGLAVGQYWRLPLTGEVLRVDKLSETEGLDERVRNAAQDRRRVPRARFQAQRCVGRIASVPHARPGARLVLQGDTSRSAA